MKKLFVLLILTSAFLILNSFCFAQNKTIDSLLILLKDDNADTGKVNHLNQLAQEYINIEDKGNGLKYGNKALALANSLPEFYQDAKGRKIAGWAKGIASAYNNIGIVCFNKGNYTAALKNYLSELKIREYIGDKKSIAASLVNIGIIYNAQGDYPEALNNYFRELNIKEEIGDKKSIAATYNNIGNIYYSVGNYYDALKNHTEALKLMLEIDDKQGVARSYSKIGNIYYSQGNYTEALKNQFASLNVKEYIGDKKSIGHTYSKIGIIYARQGNYSEALKNQLASLKCAEEINYKQGIADFYDNAGIIYCSQGKYGEALKNHSASIKIKEEISDKQGIVSSYINISEVKTKLNNLKEAQDYLSKALKVSQEIRNKEMIKDSYSRLAAIDSVQGNWKGAYMHHKLFIEYRDLIDNEETKKKIIESTMNYAFDKREDVRKAEQDKKDAEQNTKDEAAELEIHRQKTVLWSVAFGLLLVLVFAGFSVRSLRITRKQKDLIELQKNEVSIHMEMVEKQKSEVERQKEFKQQFLANMSHEIRTPMNAILGMTNLTLSTALTTKQEQYLTAVKKSSENLLEILNDILDLSKLEAGKMEMENIPFRIEDVIRQVYFVMQFKAEEKGLILTTKIESDVNPILIGDPFRLNQILINLVGNAVKFTAKGEVKIIVKKEKGTIGLIRFHVIDTGIGIPNDKIGFLFENFSQADSSTTRKFGGTGLGLSISKTLVELFNGKIEVKSELGKGSDFSFVIPFEIGNEGDIESDDQKNLNYSSLIGIKILVAEDNKYNQIVVQDTLESLIKDVVVEIADNGKIAIEKLLAADFDIILMDVQMPEMSGIEASEYIRSKMQGIKKEIPILALTSSVLEKDIKRFLAAGMNGFIPKPFKQEELLKGLAKYYNNGNAVINEANPQTKLETIKSEVKEKPIEQKVTDLTFLKEFCEGSETRMKKYIGMYLDGTPENLRKIDEALIKQEYLTVSKLAHTIKPHFNYMGITQAFELSQNIEKFAAEKINLEQIPLLIIQLKEICEKSFKELV